MRGYAFNQTFRFGTSKPSGFNYLINYNFSNTYQLNNTMYSKNTGTLQDLELNSGQGTDFGIGQDLGLTDFGATSMIYTLDGVQTYTETPFYSFDNLGVVKDVYYYNRVLTPTEITKYSSNPNDFFVDARNDATCVLNMPMDGINQYRHDYASGNDYEITNYTTSCDVGQLTYGSQSSSFPHTANVNGIPLRGDKSEFFECTSYYDNFGDTEWIPSADEDWSIECIYPIENYPSYYMGSNISSFRVGGYTNTLVVGLNGGIKTLPKNGYIHLVVNSIGEWYVDNVKQLSFDMVGFSNINTFYLGAINGQTLYKVPIPIRLFKAHPTTITQEEVTTAYNDAVNKGYLS